MNRRLARGIALSAFLSFAVLGGGGPAHAGIDVGDLAPDFEGKEFFNTEEVSLASLKGRLVFLELFSVT